MHMGKLKRTISFSYLGTKLFLYFAEVLDAMYILSVNNMGYLQDDYRFSIYELVDKLFLYTKKVILNILALSSHK